MNFNSTAKYINYFVGLILLILGLYCYISVKSFTIKEQKKIIFSTLIIAFYFIFARIGGLIIDGFNQTVTYYELILECMLQLTKRNKKCKLH